MIVDDATVTRLQVAVLGWYDRQARAFGFRGVHDPYAILVSEVILQQTQASRGEPAWRAFMARFPTVRSLAEATTADVLRQWSGLGYNRRAVNLQRAARVIVEHHAGRVPEDLAALEALPGVGPYTARAVAAIAFGRPIGAVDTNVRRVLGRVVVAHGSTRDGGHPLPARELQALADAVVAATRPADWTAALMDIGATLCRPRRPACDACPLVVACAFAAEFDAPSSGSAAVTATAGQFAVQAPERRARARAAETAAPFEASTRWLRGSIMARLSAAPPDAWLVVEGPIGTHDQAAVAAVLDALRSEGMAETDVAGRWRLPTG